MKRVSVLFILILTAIGTVAHAQAPAKPNMFPTMTACRAALESGSFRFYEPKYFGLRTHDPVNGSNLIVVPLESDACLEMLVVGGRRFVAQREGTLFRARQLADGSLSLYARDDCGNPVYGVVFPAPALPAPAEQARIGVPIVIPPVAESQHLRRMMPPPPNKKNGFCSSKKCRFAVVAVVGAAAGYAAYYYWPCPPGTVRR